MKTITVQDLFEKVETLNKTIKELGLYGQGKIPQLWVDGFYENEVKSYAEFKKVFEEGFIDEVVNSFTGVLEIHNCIGYTSYAANYDDDNDFAVTVEIRIY